MKINKNHIGYIANTTECYEFIKNEVLNNDCDSEIASFDIPDISIYRKDLIEILFLNEINKSYLLRNSAINVINNIKLGDNFNTSILNKVPFGNYEIIENKSTIYKIHVTKDTISFIRISYNPKFIGYPHVLGVLSNNANFTSPIDIDDMDLATHDLIIKSLIFIYCSEITEEYLKPHSRIGKIRIDKIINETNSPYIIVGSKWNIKSIRSEGFRVSGHFRLQPCGERRQDKKLIFIDEFEKNGYVRKAKSLEQSV